MPSGDYFLDMIDLYSRFPEVEIIRCTKAPVAIADLDKIFSVHGILETVKTDNGPQFSCDDFDRYLEIIGMSNEPSTPCWPQAD